MKCPKCKKEMIRWISPTDKRNFSYECEKCNYDWFSKRAIKEFKKCVQDMKEGRTYIWCCGLKRGKCQKTGEKPTVCHTCSTEQAKKWYRLGRNDERRKKLS